MIGDFFTIFPLMVCVFWSAVFVLDWRHNPPSKHLLTIFMEVCALLLLCRGLFFNIVSSIPILAISNCIYIFCNLAVFPLFYLYICRLTKIGPLSLGKWAIMIPSIGMFLWAAALTIFIPHNFFAFNWCYSLTKIIFLVQLVPICWLGWWRLRKFDLIIKNACPHSVANIRRLIILLFFGGLLSSIVDFIGSDWLTTSFALSSALSTLFAVLLFAVGYVGLKQNFDADDFANESEEENPSAPSDSNNPPPESTINLGRLPF